MIIIDLGNRTNVYLRSDTNESYSVNNTTNRYNSVGVGGTSLTYDAAGNLTKDKNGYEYAYDYESRLIAVTKDSQAKASFAYDALGRRIQRKDLIDPNNSRRYYNNYNWQVLAEHNGSDAFQRWFAYGNSIDDTAPI